MASSSCFAGFSDILQTTEAAYFPESNTVFVFLLRNTAILSKYNLELTLPLGKDV